MSATQTRIIVIGDEMVSGIGDPKGLGWLGRVGARTNSNEPISFFPLAVPEETTTGLSQRWEAEFNRRFINDPAVSYRLVIALGQHDVFRNLSMARSRLNLANILDVAMHRRLPVFVVGPAPAIGPASEHLSSLSAAYAEVCQRRKAPYVELCQPLANHEQWITDLQASPLRNPGQAGYGLIAWLVLHSGWHQWLNLPDEQYQP